MKYLSLILILLVSACTQQATNLNLDESTNSNATSGVGTITTQTAETRQNYNLSSFSQWVYLHKTENKILIDVNFLPEGHDLCQQATYHETSNPNGCRQDLSVSIPCEYNSLPESDLLNINLSVSTTVPVATSCTNPIVVDLSAATFDADGLIFTAPVTAFQSDFGFQITMDGFVDPADSSLLIFDTQDVKLEDVYETIVDRRTSS